MASESKPERTIDDLVFVGFNRYVVALDRYSGEEVWRWKSPQGQSYVAVMLDGDRLIVSANGYMYCLDPLFGQTVWSNPLRGLGTGAPCLTSMRGQNTANALPGMAQSHRHHQAAAAGGASAGA